MLEEGLNNGTRVKKKRDRQEIVVDDNDNDEDTIYRFGVREKTRYEPYHVYLTLNPDSGRYWDIEARPDQKNAKFLTPKSIF